MATRRSRRSPSSTAGRTASCWSRSRAGSAGRDTPFSPPIPARCSATAGGACARWTRGHRLAGGRDRRGAARAPRPAAPPASAGGRAGAAALHRRRGGIPRLRHRADHRVAARRAARRPRPARRGHDGDRHAAGARQSVQPRDGHRQRRGGPRGGRRRAAPALRRGGGADRRLGRPARRAGRRSSRWPSIRRARCRRPSRRTPTSGSRTTCAGSRSTSRAGDTFQTVLSRRLEVAAPDPFLTYRYLRALNPAPYLYYLHCDDIHVIGSSPEILVRVEDGEVTLRPIAGTRPRGATPEEDAALAEELAADPKERAEHLMLVDLGRNDVGRVAEFGSVRLTAFMTIERYSHVMHLVSEVRGRLRPELDAVAALAASFPAGTVSGAPKVRAMQIIDELEPVRRGPYAGAVGYIGWGGRTMDTAIAIRTCVMRGGRAWIQAGAGIVADSDPAAEWRETEAKARAVLLALALARGRRAAAADGRVADRLAPSAPPRPPRPSYIPPCPRSASSAPPATRPSSCRRAGAWSSAAASPATSPSTTRPSPAGTPSSPSAPTACRSRISAAPTGPASTAPGSRRPARAQRHRHLRQGGLPAETAGGPRPPSMQRPALAAEVGPPAARSSASSW